MMMDVNFLGNSQGIGFADVTPLKGATFTPSVSDEGVLSWTNDQGLQNPAPVNIKGDPGVDGNDGSSINVTVSEFNGGSYINLYTIGSDGVAEDIKIVKVSNGADGKDGATFVPCVSVTGLLSWENDQGLPNPEPIYLKGENGKTPEVYVDTVEGGHRIMIRTEGVQATPTFYVMDGADGKDGYTPVKGEDYWTEADKAEILAETGEQWQLLCDATTTEEIVQFGIDRDMDGNPFSCRKIAAQMILPDYMGSNIQFAFGNALVLYGGQPAIEINPNWKAATTFDFQVELVKNQFAVFKFNQRYIKNFMSQYGDDGCISTLGAAGTSALTKFFIANVYTANPFPVGTRILIWGCKA